MKISPATKVGILTLISLVILTLGIMWLKGRAISAGERTEVRFHDVDGMRPGSAVQMMGIRIGQVEEVLPVITDDESYVTVKFVITEDDITIPQASTISIQQSGIIGEKFLEITPPQVQTALLPINHHIKTIINEKTPVELLVGNEYIPVGEIKNAEIVNIKTLTPIQQENIVTTYAYKIGYIVTKPGVIIPEDSIASLKTLSASNPNNKYVLRLTPPKDIIAQISANGKYTIVEPIRLKKFFDVQLESAIALQETNDKINSLLSEESIDDLKTILKNTKHLSKEATSTLSLATELLRSSKTEIDNISTLAQDLSGKMVVLADNINNIVGDPEVKNSLLSTTKSIQKSASSISEMLEDPTLKETLALVNNSAQDLSEITSYINNITQDQELKGKLDSTLVNLNDSLSKLSVTLDNVNSLNTEEKDNLKEILNDSSEISENLKLFSNKLNKRFLLFRLLF
ncbi:MAG: hypothetical protein A2287_00365 [Candidatus Melainabacteria bacterium RIFOXYA12_FULL_32_12]|nr:MAG: hypothetical protein A2255_07335 [Candidatus Melainabacteria bacterium RIFOXYA2_FULL_32_9]OGI31397.1 MAG: hypothetical protein A2287_00365 [Candidatus Melainabacteria bacterium RIFOXYA12_FULL_32_12]